MQDLITGKVDITSQNHGFCVDMDSLKDPDIEISHINLNDNTVEGLFHKKIRSFCAVSRRHRPAPMMRITSLRIW